MHPDPEGDPDIEWSIRDSDFQVLAMEKSNDLIYYKVRVWRTIYETADRYAAADTLIPPLSGHPES